MEKTFIRDRGCCYSVEATNFGMEILGNFLTDDARNFGSFYKKFLDDPWSNSTGGDYSDLTIIGEKVLISCNYLPDEPDEEVFETTVDELHYILDRWEELYKQNPHEIIITRENGTLTLEGKNS